MLNVDDRLKVLAMNVKQLQATRRLIEAVGIEKIEAIVKKEEAQAATSKKAFYKNLIEEVDYIKHFKDLRGIN